MCMQGIAQQQMRDDAGMICMNVFANVEWSMTVCVEDGKYESTYTGGCLQSSS